MATTIERAGGLLKITVDGTLQEPINLLDINPLIEGDNVIFSNGTTVDFNDVTTPVVASAEDVFDAIAGFIFDYNSGI